MRINDLDYIEGKIKAWLWSVSEREYKNLPLRLTNRHLHDIDIIKYAKKSTFLTLKVFYQEKTYR